MPAPPYTVYPFRLSFTGNAAYFPFIMDNAPLPAFAALSCRDAGTTEKADVPGARAQFCRSLGLDPSRVFSCVQVHGQEVRVAERNVPEAEGDGIVTDDPAAILSVTVADCLPVFLHDPKRGVFALVHSGWRGTGISLRALARMREIWHTRPEETAAILGPCVRECCYEVPEGRARDFAARFGGEGGAYPLGPVAREEAGLWSMDLQAANARLLVHAGIRNIAVCEDCTACDQRLGSFRREGERYTRMFALCPVPMPPAKKTSL
ncbi:MAG: polyphenol oxidase family protein [Spirochaetaceae bacterium]|jgi:YfiH family protein|nr:polyphenol oxidase family protein [Spirochaetaceae bacterium]